MKIFLIVALIFIFYIYFSNKNIIFTKYDIFCDVPKPFNGFKILQISDFQNDNYGNKIEKLEKFLKENQIDIIVITGDLVDSYHPNVDKSLEIVDKLKYFANIFYCSGNHESRLEYKNIKIELIKRNVIVLDDEFITLEKDNYKIDIIGLKDFDFDNKLVSVRIENMKLDNSFKILLSHRPEFFKEYVKNNIDLIFTGHAHGGQVRIPFIGGLFAPGQGIFPKYTSGIYEKEKSKMVVNRGLGNSRYRFRINNTPEVIIVNLINR